MENVIPDACRWSAEGYRVALVTLVGIDGSSPRPLGSQMAVREDGRYVGLISGGCVEAALVHETLAALSDGRNRKLRYGKDSPYFDIRLPCGSGIDVLIDVGISSAILKAVLQYQQRREPVMLCVDVEAATSVQANPEQYLQLEPCHDQPDVATHISRDTLNRVYRPTTRVLAFGRGEIFRQLVNLAPAVGFEVLAVTPDAVDVQDEEKGYIPLSRPDLFDPAWCDPWTAAALLFHDHEWEGPILQHLINSDCFYVGALGSLRSQALRCEWLKESGANDQQIARIKGPIGLNIGGRTPPEIAISILAEIISRQSGHL
ncbi:carbon monoxide dehydrogenase maturation protein [Hahella sp. CCB-MM4]|nr:carbon monoxide dehydrogenase maturation protein [Hahella sp. CCB-MM4]